MAAPQTAKVQGFKDVGLALRIRPDENRDASVRHDRRLLVISEIFESQRLYTHNQTSLKPPRSEEGVWGQCPQAGFRAAALTYPQIAKRNNTGIGEEPSGDNYDSDQA